jgi:hypothetical protein
MPIKTKNEASLNKIEETLNAKGIKHYKWVEQPENFPTALATIPVFRSQLGDAFKKCQLYK